MGVGKAIVDSAALGGRVKAFFSAIVVTIICLIVMATAIYFLVKEYKVKKVDAVIKVVTCKEPSPEGATECVLQVTYDPGTGSKPGSVTVFDNETYTVGKVITCEFNPSTGILTYGRKSSKTGLWLASTLPLLFIGLSWGWYAVTRKSKFIAASSAVGSLVSGLRR